MSRLLIFGITSAAGGIENLMKYLIFDSVAKRKFESVLIITSFEKIAFESEYINLGVEIVKIPSRKNKKQYRAALKQIINSTSKEDILYLNISTFCNWLLFNEIKKASCDIIIHGHNAKVSNPFKKILHYFGKIKFKNLGRTVAVSKECSHFMFNDKANAIIENGINSCDYFFKKTNRERIRQELSIDENSITIGCVGRISKEKNQIYLSRISKKYSKYLFVFIGDFMSNSYKKKVLSCSSSNCLFVGQKNNIGEYLSALDAIVIPSKSEAFPLVAVESLTNSLPVFCNQKLKNKLPSAIAENKNCYYLVNDAFNEQIVIKSHAKRTTGDVETSDTYDIRYFLEKMYSFFEEK